MALRAENPREILSPPPAIDALWHAHILCTRIYGEFCDTYMGGYLHHDPEAGSMAQYLTLLRKYGEKYGEQEYDEGSGVIKRGETGRWPGSTLAMDYGTQSSSGSVMEISFVGDGCERDLSVLHPTLLIDPDSTRGPHHHHSPSPS